MVGRGEFLERMTIVTSDGNELEALYQRGGHGKRAPVDALALDDDDHDDDDSDDDDSDDDDSDAGARGGDAQPVVLASPHPRLGGNMDSAVLAEIVWTLARACHPTLRFNYRGVSASRGVITLPDLATLAAPLPASALAAEARDLTAAVDHHLADRPNRTCALVGYSTGAIVAAIVAAEHPAVDRAILIAPPVKVFVIDWTLLARSGIPVSILCGSVDTWAAPDDIRAAVGDLAVAVIDSANHAFSSGLPELARRVRASFPSSADDDDDMPKRGRRGAAL